jgi:hypothetical protein
VIITDLQSFLVILACFMLMFGNVFYIIGHRYDEEDEHAADDDGGEPEPFSTAQEAFLSLYRMMLGDSDRSWFSSEVATFFFFLYSFFVQIIILSMLIAVVSDSYDFAIIRSVKLFDRALCEQGL